MKQIATILLTIYLTYMTFIVTTEPDTIIAKFAVLLMFGIPALLGCLIGLTYEN
jgi:hypothetical protein